MVAMCPEGAMFMRDVDCEEKDAQFIFDMLTKSIEVVWLQNGVRVIWMLVEARFGHIF